MDTKSRELFEKILSYDIDGGLKADIIKHLKFSPYTYEVQNISKEDLKIVFEEINLQKVSESDMMDIAKTMRSAGVSEDYWFLLTQAGNEILGIVDGVLPDNLK